MIQINEDYIKKYREIYFEKYGVPIEASKALDELTALMGLLHAVHRHMKKFNWTEFNDN